MSEGEANEILRQGGKYQNPLSGEFFPFPAPEPSTEILKMFPNLATMPRDSNAKLKLLHSRAKTYDDILSKLAGAGEISFYDPLTLLRISDANEATEPMVDMDKIAAQIIQYREVHASPTAEVSLSKPQPAPASEPVKPAAAPPLPQADKVSVSKPQRAAEGITKEQVLIAFAELVEPFDLRKALGNGKGLFGETAPGSARTQKGSPGGKHTALWNPVILAVGLHEKYKVPMPHLKRAFSDHPFLRMWFDEWSDTLARFVD